MQILVTGCAGFIGYHLCLKLLQDKKNYVYGIDVMDPYYDLKLKINRIKDIKKKYKKFIFYKKDIGNLKFLKNNFKKNKYDYVINLAAQAGVRYSLIDRNKYLKNNIIGFFNILESCKELKIKHLIFASTSSVYGNNKKFPYRETDNTDKPLSFYAATKKSNEVMAYSYSNLYKIPCTGLRFFTVYGPYGRPDMSLFKFTQAILKSKKIELYNKGKHFRDFTYIDDVVEGISKLLTKPPIKKIPYSIYNLGNGKPTSLKLFVKIIENSIGKKTKIALKPFQTGDVYKTHANINSLKRLINFNPKTNVNVGIKKFIYWYKKYKKIK
tara:strand:- start:2379 stop:3353 length:975 start_codon:yes stop_codon:yes gene_type:complete